MVTVTVFSEKQKILALSGDVLEIRAIRSFFSVPNPARFSKNPFIPDRLYAVTPNGRFDFGLLGEIEKFCQTQKIKLEVQPPVLSLFPQLVPKNPDFDLQGLDREYRLYQREGIQKALMSGFGVLVLGTGGGKTLLTAGLIVNFRKIHQNPNAKVIVTVPTKQLVDQTAKDFEEYGLGDVFKWSGTTEFDPKAKIVVANNQKLVSKNTDLSVLDSFDLFIADEVHTYGKGNEIEKVFRFFNKSSRFGMTGSMPSNQIDYWNIIGKFGPVFYEKKTDELKKESYLSDFKIWILTINHPQTFFTGDTSEKPTEKYEKELEYLKRSERRNEIICKLCSRLEGNTVVMTERLEHAEILVEKIKGCCPEKEVFYIHGKIPVEDREKVRSILSEKNNAVIVAISRIFSTGINIPSIQNIIFASAGKAKIKIIQSIGRALRLHKNKEIAKIFDISDNTYYGSIHKEQRKKIYTSENYEYTEKFL